MRARPVLAFAPFLSAVAAARSGGPPAPGPLGQTYLWRNVEIVGGGFVTGVLYHPAQPDLVYARTDIGGAYRLDPANRRWVPIEDRFGVADYMRYGVESFAVDPADPRRVYLATGMYLSAGHGVVLCSDDQGATWLQSPVPFAMGGNEDGRSIGERLMVDPADGRVLFLGSRQSGLWRSADRGLTWAHVEGLPMRDVLPKIGVCFVLFDPAGSTPGTPTRTVYVGVASKGTHLFRSTDAGATWQPVPCQTPGLIPHHAALANDGSLYVTYGNGPGPNGVTDGAVRKLDTHPDRWTDVTPVRSDDRTRFGYAGLTVGPNGVVMVSTLDRWSPGDDIFRSTNGGRTWTSLKDHSLRDDSASPFLRFHRHDVPFGHWIGCVQVDPHRPDRAMYVTGATVWRTDDLTAVDRGQTVHWTVGAAGLEETADIDLTSSPAGAHLLSGLGDIGGFRHDDLAVSPPAGMFDTPLMTNTDCLDFAERRPEVVVRVGRGKPGQQGAISHDGGTTWAPFAVDPSGRRGGGTVALSADAGVILWSPARGQGRGPVWRSTDGGVTWGEARGLPAGCRVVADRVDVARFYGVDGSTGKVYASSDAGATFDAVGTVKVGGKVRALPGRAGELWMPSGGEGLMRSTDGGATWGRLPGVDAASAVGFGKGAPGRDGPAVFFSGTVAGVAGAFRSDDAGATSVRITDDRHQFGAINSTIIGDPRVYGRVYLGTNGRGVLYGDPR
jgi:hypothetical protein